MCNKYTKKFIYRARDRSIAMSETPIQRYLAENPRMMGVLFTILLLLVGTESALAANMGAVAGP